MDVKSNLPAITQLIEQRLALVGALAESLELGTSALTRNDAEAIARGAAHQAELCRQWSCLEGKLRRQTRKSTVPVPRDAHNHSLALEPSLTLETSAALKHSAQLQSDWDALTLRIRYLTRVHGSLLRHLQRSLAVLDRVVESCDNTYTAAPRFVLAETALRTEG